MQYTIVDKAKAPKAAERSARVSKYAELIKSLIPGKAAVLGLNGKGRISITASIRAQAGRQGKRISTYITADGESLVIELAEGKDTKKAASKNEKKATGNRLVKKSVKKNPTKKNPTKEKSEESAELPF